MAKFLADGAHDAALAYMSANGVKLVICNGQPVTFNEAITDKGTTVAGGGTARALGETTFGSSFFTGPTTAATNGRKIVTASISGISIDVTSTNADHIAIIGTTASGLLVAVTTITSPQDVVSGNTATVNTFTYRVADVT